MSDKTVKIGIIGGSGVYNANFLKDTKEVKVSTPFGEPSDVLLHGTIENIPCILISRHGRKHQHTPTNINYRANIWALKEAGVTHIIVITACGSLKEELCPGDIVFLDQFIDRTTKRVSTFYDGHTHSPKGVCHIPLAYPFCSKTTAVLIDSAEKLGFKHHVKGTCIIVEGPRFSTRAEEKIYQMWGGDVINMTTVPEVTLANELGMFYSAIAMVTDYGGWKDTEVTVEGVMKIIGSIVKKAEEIIVKSIPVMASMDWSEEIQTKQKLAQDAVMNLS